MAIRLDYAELRGNRVYTDESDISFHSLYQHVQT